MSFKFPYLFAVVGIDVDGVGFRASCDVLIVHKINAKDGL